MVRMLLFIYDLNVYVCMYVCMYVHVYKQLSYAVLYLNTVCLKLTVDIHADRAALVFWSMKLFVILTSRKHTCHLIAPTSTSTVALTCLCKDLISKKYKHDHFSLLLYILPVCIMVCVITSQTSEEGTGPGDQYWSNMKQKLSLPLLSNTLVLNFSKIKEHIVK